MAVRTQRPIPKRQTEDLSLREKEKQIQQDMFNQIVSNGGNYTVLTLVEKYVSLKTGVRHNTEAGYKTVINILKKDPFGSRRIDKVKLQYIMGHSDISVTLNTYTHVGFEDAQNELKRVVGE